jgi:sarcosine oxidase subunit alpha
VSDQPGVRFTFEGREITARPGQSIAGALHAAGVSVLSWSSKYRRPRGYRCGTGACPGCTLKVDGNPGVVGCMTPVRGGERVERIRPWLRWLPADRFGALVPAGFQGSRLLRGRRVWRLAEPLLRRLAGVAPVAAASPSRIGAYAEVSVDLLVVGGGRSGLATARDAAAQGQRVLLVERDYRLGGRLLGVPGGGDDVAMLTDSARDAGVDVRLQAAALGSFADGVSGVAVDGGLVAVRATRTAWCTGSLDQPVALPDGDRPGVMLASAVRRLIVREGVTPGRLAVIVANDPADSEAGELQALLADAGCRVVAVCGAGDVRAIHGRDRVRGVTIGERRVSADLVVIFGGRGPADELRRHGDAAVSTAYR